MFFFFYFCYCLSQVTPFLFTQTQLIQLEKKFERDIQGQDTIRACRPWWWKTEESVGFFAKHIKETICGGLLGFKEMCRMTMEDFETVVYMVRAFLAAVKVHFDLMLVIFLLLLICTAFYFCWIIPNSKF